MNLSENTILTLKNFSHINSNIVIKPGKVLKTMSDQRTVMARVELEEEFPIEVGIYDLNEFLNVLGLVDNPELDFKEKYVVVADSSGRSKIKYFYSSPEILTSPSKDIVMPNCEVEFTLDDTTLQRLKRAASALGHDKVSITGKDGVITLSVMNHENKTSNQFSIDIAGDFDDVDFNFIVNINNLKLLPGDYLVNISKKLISHFVNKDLNVEYWIALEKDSKYNE